MTRYTDCEARGIVTPGCSCTFCRDRIVADGKRVRVPLMMMDTAGDSRRWADAATPIADADHWPAAIFDAAGVPIREDTLSPHEQALRAGLSSVAAEERQKARKQAEEGRQQSRTANRQARAGSGEWDRALAKIHTGSVREARMSRA